MEKGPGGGCARVVWLRPEVEEKAKDIQISELYRRIGQLNVERSGL